MTLDIIAEKVSLGRTNEVRCLVNKALREGFKPKDILENGLVNGMTYISDKYRNLEIHVPDVLLASRAMQGGLRLLKPLLSDANPASKGLVVIGTVEGDIHDIGKSLVSVVMTAAQYRVIDLGVDVTADKFVSAVRDLKPEVLGMSALLTVTMGVMGDCIESLKKANLRYPCKVIVGGAPVSLQFAEEIGADGYGVDAVEALEVVESLLGRKSAQSRCFL